MRAPSRPASARASSSRSDTSLLMRREERSADAVASASSLRPDSSSDSWSSSRLASVLVSGVRSSCEASATKSRWACIACSRSVRASSSARSIWSSVAASSPTSSSATGRGTRREGSRVAAISRAAPVRAAIGRIARRATTNPATAASTVPTSTPVARKSHMRSIVESRSLRLRAYWT